jgi:5,10-methylenetetrahydrofolate reductase
VGNHQPAGAAAAELRVGDLWRRRIDAERTHSTIARILKETRLTPAAHLTCVGAPKGEIDDVVARYHEIGVRHIVALRGDPTTGIGTAYHAHPDGYQSSPDLIAGIKKRYPGYRSLGFGLSRKASGEPDSRRRHRHAEGQGRCRRGARHHAGVLR